jgi:alkylated DNA repair protein (DNA oxidative demethylase)
MADALIPRRPVQVADGAVHLPDWLDLDEQRRMVAACREWASPPGRLRAVRLPSGGLMSVKMVCLGWHWVPYRYTRTLDDGSSVTPFPDWLAELGRRAVSEAYRDRAAGAAYHPDIGLVNYYGEGAKMGLHQDRDEHSSEPVVSLSLGDSCVFRFGNTRNRGRPWTDVPLHSGDLFVFGGPSRLAYHGVPKVLPGTADPAIGLPRGRLNITLRVSGLTDSRAG